MAIDMDQKKFWRALRRANR